MRIGIASERLRLNPSLPFTSLVVKRVVFPGIIVIISIGTGITIMGNSDKWGRWSLPWYVIMFTS